VLLLANLAVSVLFLFGIYLVTSVDHLVPERRAIGPKRIARAAAWVSCAGQMSGEVMAGSLQNAEVSLASDLLLVAGCAAAFVAAWFVVVSFRDRRVEPARRSPIPAIGAGLAVWLMGLGLATLALAGVTVLGQVPSPVAGAETGIACLGFAAMGCSLVAAVSFLRFALLSPRGK